MDRSGALRVLDRPGLRTALGLVHSAEILARDRELGLVVPEREGGWRLRSGGAQLFAPSPKIRPPGRLRERVADVFCHAFTPGPGDTVLDVGAGVGREGFVFADLVSPGGTVHCIEAHPATFTLLRRMVAANDLTNVCCHQLAVSDEIAEVTTDTDEDARLYYRTKLVRGREGVTVSAVTLASFMHEQAIGSVDLLAMNIEGAEVAGLRGMAPVVDRVRNVAIACHDFLADETGDDRMRTKAEVRGLLREYGFTVSDHAAEVPSWRRDFVYGVRR